MSRSRSAQKKANVAADIGTSSEKRRPDANRGWLLAALLVSSCASAGPLPDVAPSPKDPAEALRIQLIFGPEADLDLLVTDPAEETIYFANTRSSATGGALEADRRCGDPVPRIETIAFQDAPPGRYLVGVDFPERCRSLQGPVPFRVIVLDGARRQERTGEIALGEFVPRLIELDR